MAVIPYDAAAEAAVVGCAIASQHGAALAAGRLGAEDFYDPRTRRLYAAALELVGVAHEDQRIVLAAAEAGMAEAEVEAVVHARPVAWDSAGTYAARVLEAAYRRRLMAQAEALYRRAAGADPAELERLVDDLAAAS